jgi:hypothetical protein
LIRSRPYRYRFMISALWLEQEETTILYFLHETRPRILKLESAHCTAITCFQLRMISAETLLSQLPQDVLVSVLRSILDLLSPLTAISLRHWPRECWTVQLQTFNSSAIGLQIALNLSYGYCSQCSTCTSTQIAFL